MGKIKKEDMEYLKELIRNHIKSEEEANRSFKKILRRITMACTIGCVVIIAEVGVIIHIENQPYSKLNEVLKATKDLETRISLQREYINMNTKDIQDINEVKDSAK